MGRKDEARQYLGKVLEEYPASNYAKKAKSKLGKAPPAPEKPATAAISVDSKPQTQ
jgi:outer membrane protein assembly factor BamD (BamD/ComL family)